MNRLQTKAYKLGLQDAYNRRPYRRSIPKESVLRTFLPEYQQGWDTGCLDMEIKKAFVGGDQ